jgi:hypothetical protein
MLKRLYTTLVILLLASTVTLVAGHQKLPKAKVVDESVNTGVVTNAISTNIAAHLEKTTVGTATQIGATCYDYMFNSGGPTMCVYWKGTTYFIFVGKPTSASKRTILYVSYDGTTFTTPQQIVDSSTQSTYFSGIDVFRGGAADGFAAVGAGWAGSGKSYYGLEASKGAGGFTPIVVSPDRDLGVLTLDSLGAILVKDTKGRTDFKLQRSTDFGVTWANADTAVALHASGIPKGQTGGDNLDVPMFRFPNGDIGIGACLGGTGAQPPSGTATKDSADITGYFKSTNKGNTWTWTTIITDGDQCLPNYYYNPENFGQIDMLADKNNKVHAVFNGIPEYYKITGSDTTDLNTMDCLYWDATNGFKSLVSFNRTDTIINGQVLPFSARANTTNAYGCSYPSIAISDDGNVILCTWSQPNYHATGFTSTDTVSATAGVTTRSDIWFNYSVDGGATWKGAQALTSTTDKAETFGMLAENLQKTSATTVRARMMYVADGHPYPSPFAGDIVPEPVMYHEWDIVTTGIRPEPGVATSFELNQNYPNPFNPSTKIDYSIQKNAFVTLKVYNVLGQEVAALVNGDQAAGKYSVDFDGSKLASGMYLYKIQAGNFSDVKKMLLTK